MAAVRNNKVGYGWKKIPLRVVANTKAQNS